LTRSLVGSSDIVRSVVDIFSENPDIGIVMCEHFEPIRAHINWDYNFPIARFGGPFNGQRRALRRGRNSDHAGMSAALAIAAKAVSGKLCCMLAITHPRPRS
jgi:hypothetical protein